MKVFIVALLATACLASPVPQEDVKCGSPAVAPDTSSNIIGGKPAIPYSWPWSAVLCTGNDQKCSLKCGGTLISKQWIMTAGHCFQKSDSPSSVRFKVGVFNQTRNDENGEAVLQISEFHIHPKYSGGGGQVPPTFDITLVKLTEPLQFTDHISPVCLPKTLDAELPAADTTITLTGWGRTKNSASAPANPTLEQVTVPLVSREKCKKFLWNQEFSTIFCVGFDQGGKGSCSGDSGGPAVFRDPANENRWTQIGITSFGKGSIFAPCSGEYSGYSKVSAYVDFIKQYVTDLD